MRAEATDFAPETTRAVALATMTAAFRAAGIETPERDARKLMLGILDVDNVALILEPVAPLGHSASALREALRRRSAHEPVSRILGRRDFFGHTFRISPATLDPRADSECVVAAAIELLSTQTAALTPHILDIGTGSGCLLLSILAAIPDATGVGTDIDPAALAVAEDNAQRLGLSGSRDVRRWKRHRTGGWATFRSCGEQSAVYRDGGNRPSGAGSASL